MICKYETYMKANTFMMRLILKQLGRAKINPWDVLCMNLGKDEMAFNE